MKYCFQIVSLLVSFHVQAQDTTYYDHNGRYCRPTQARKYEVLTRTSIGARIQQYYSSNGQLAFEAEYSKLTDDVKEGRVIAYNESGQLTYEGSYEGGKPIGKHVRYYDNGKVQSIENYSLGQAEGEYITYYPNGQLEVKLNFKDGQYHGPVVSYFENGQVRSTGSYLNGNREGLWNFYDEKGIEISSDYYQTQYEIPSANLYFELPNDYWRLEKQRNDAGLEFVFFRLASTLDTTEYRFTLAINLIINDATGFNGNVEEYSWHIRNALSESFWGENLKISEVLNPHDSGYPLEFYNALFLKGSYVLNGEDMEVYIIHAISDNAKGIQFYYDKAVDAPEEYEKEFWKSIHSIRILNKGN